VYTAVYILVLHFSNIYVDHLNQGKREIHSHITYEQG